VSTPIPIQTIPMPPTRITTFYTWGTFEPLTFEWTRRMPNNGYLGNVTFRQFQKKKIQVFDPKLIETYGVVLGTSWAYQAQDGSFLCRMFVSAFGDLYVTFSDRKKGDWPLISVLAPHHAISGDPAGQTSSLESNQVT
jgi:hypothetical protein